MIKKLFAGWNLAKALPLVAVSVALGLFLAFGFKECKNLLTITVASKGIDSASIAKQFADLIAEIEKTKGGDTTIYFSEVIAGPVVDTQHDCWGSAFILFGRDTVTIDSANSCKGIYRGAWLRKAPPIDSATVRRMIRAVDSLKAIVTLLTTPSKLPLFSSLGKDSGAQSIFGDRPAMGYEFEGRLGTSLPGNMMIGVDAKAWIGRYGVFGNGRIVAPELGKSSLDLGVSYKF